MQRSKSVTQKEKEATSNPSAGVERTSNRAKKKQRQKLRHQMESKDTDARPSDDENQDGGQGSSPADLKRCELDGCDTQLRAGTGRPFVPAVPCGRCGDLVGPLERHYICGWHPRRKICSECFDRAAAADRDEEPKEEPTDEGEDEVQRQHERSRGSKAEEVENEESTNTWHIDGSESGGKAEQFAKEKFKKVRFKEDECVANAPKWATASSHASGSKGQKRSKRFKEVSDEDEEAKKARKSNTEVFDDLYAEIGKETAFSDHALQKAEEVESVDEETESGWAKPVQ